VFLGIRTNPKHPTPCDTQGRRKSFQRPRRDPFSASPRRLMTSFCSMDRGTTFLQK